MLFYTTHGHRRRTSDTVDEVLRGIKAQLLLAQMAPYVHFSSAAACSEQEVGEYDRQMHSFQLDLVKEWLPSIPRRLNKVEQPKNISKQPYGASRRIMMLDSTAEEEEGSWARMDKHFMGTLSRENTYAKSWELPSLRRVPWGFAGEAVMKANSLRSSSHRIAHASIARISQCARASITQPSLTLYVLYPRDSSPDAMSARFVVMSAINLGNSLGTSELAPNDNCSALWKCCVVGTGPLGNKQGGAPRGTAPNRVPPLSVPC